MIKLVTNVVSAYFALRGDGCAVVSRAMTQHKRLISIFTFF